MGREEAWKPQEGLGTRPEEEGELGMGLRVTMRPPYVGDGLDLGLGIFILIEQVWNRDGIRIGF
jgi:hypothetical protein